MQNSLLTFIVMASLAQTAASSEKKIKGYADLHSHMTAHRGFGQAFFHGATHHEAGIEAALKSCAVLHGSNGKDDIAGNLIFRKPGASHGNTPFSSDDPWPSRTNQNHQQMYFEWIKRAHEGGMKLIVSHAVNNSLACQILAGGAKDDTDCNDTKVAEKQIAEMYDLEKYIAEKDGGWFKIVTSPKQARRVIAEGNLAVVLGLELDYLFDCELKECDATVVQQKIEKYRKLGIRHLFPIHLFTNGIGGPSYSNEFLLLGDMLLSGVQPLEQKCDEIFVGGISDGQGGYKCSPLGITEHGEFILKKLMANKMIIDIDHMSSDAMESTLLLSQEYDYPIVSGHSGVRGVSKLPFLTEDKKTDEQILQIYRSGGMMAPILSARGVDGHKPYSYMDHNCDGSASGWATAYLYVRDLLEKNNIIGAIGIGSDFNGMINLPSGRFGPKGCNGNAAQVLLQAPASRVTYPFTTFLAKKITEPFTLKIGGRSRVFDYNNEGLAHVGMLPEFFEDMKKQGLKDSDMDSLMNSAEAYVSMWEKVEKQAVYAPADAIVRKYAVPDSLEKMITPEKELYRAEFPESYECPSEMPCSKVVRNFIFLKLDGTNYLASGIKQKDLTGRTCTREIAQIQGGSEVSCECTCRR